MTEKSDVCLRTGAVAVFVFLLFFVIKVLRMLVVGRLKINTEQLIDTTMAIPDCRASTKHADSRSHTVLLNANENTFTQSAKTAMKSNHEQGHAAIGVKRFVLMV
jgi:hypothetical protein